jgi:hypothetical protein
MRLPRHCHPVTFTERATATAAVLFSCVAAGGADLRFLLAAIATPRFYGGPLFVACYRAVAGVVCLVLLATRASPLLKIMVTVLPYARQLPLPFMHAVNGFILRRSRL